MKKNPEKIAKELNEAIRISVGEFLLILRRYDNSINARSSFIEVSDALERLGLSVKFERKKDL